MILDVEKVSKVYPVKGANGVWKREGVSALRDVSLALPRGSSYGLVGESGSGKTTLTRCVLGLESVTSGVIRFDGEDVAALDPKGMRRLRSRMQIVFQDPYASLNPRMTVHDAVAEAMVIHNDVLKLTRQQRTERVAKLLQQVGLSAEHLYRHPHEFSGGQRQRIGIARALAVEPEVLVLDEPTSALDVSVQAEILNLLHRLQENYGLTYLFVSHDLGVIRYMCDDVAVIYRGSIVEKGPVRQIFEAPESDYARMLLEAMPDPDPDRSPFRRASEGAGN